jgi:hypothetical protein
MPKSKARAKFIHSLKNALTAKNFDEHGFKQLVGQITLDHKINERIISDKNISHTLLSYAASLQHVEAMKIVLANEANPNATSITPHRKKISILEYISSWQKPEQKEAALKLMIDSKKVDMSWLDTHETKHTKIKAAATSKVELAEDQPGPSTNTDPIFPQEDNSKPAAEESHPVGPTQQSEEDNSPPARAADNKLLESYLQVDWSAELDGWETVDSGTTEDDGGWIDVQRPEDISIAGEVEGTGPV